MRVQFVVLRGAAKGLMLRIGHRSRLVKLINNLPHKVLKLGKSVSNPCMRTHCKRWSRHLASMVNLNLKPCPHKTTKRPLCTAGKRCHMWMLPLLKRTAQRIAIVLTHREAPTKLCRTSTVQGMITLLLNKKMVALRPTSLVLKVSAKIIIMPISWKTNLMSRWLELRII